MPSPREADKDDPLSLKEVASRLTVSERTVQRLVKLGKFPPPVYFGAHPRWFPKDVESYLWLRMRSADGSKPEMEEEKSPRKTGD